jgi:hypothetical protein
MAITITNNTHTIDLVYGNGSRLYSIQKNDCGIELEGDKVLLYDSGVSPKDRHEIDYSDVSGETSGTTLYTTIKGYINSQATDYNLEVLKGNVEGSTMVSIRGHDNTVPNGGPFGLSQGFGGGGYQFDQSAIAAVAASVSVASTDNTKDNVGNVGALTVRVFGLDSNGDAATEDLTLTGQTEVTTSAKFTAVHQLLVLATGSENDNSGTLWCGTGTFTAGVPAVRMLSMTPGFNISLSGYYVVPTGKIFYPRQFIATVGSSNKDVQVHIVTSASGIQHYTQIEFGIEGGDFTTDIIALPGIPARTHISLRAGGGAASTDVTAIIAGELIDV